MPAIASNWAVLAICLLVAIFAAVATVRWANRRRLLQTIAVCLGVVFVLITTHRDRVVSDAQKTNLDSYRAELERAESTASQMAVQNEQIESDNQSLKALLSKSSEEKKAAAEEARLLHAALLDAAKSVGEVVPDPSNKATTLRIKDSVLFDIDKAVLSCQSKEALSKVIGFLTYQIRVPRTRIQVVGHTDSTGTDEHDDALSKSRAEAVRSYFASSGIPPEIINADGMGKKQPAGFVEPQSADVIERQNKTPEQRQKNRRVEIVVSAP